jgi:hypothetical protein
MKVARFIFVVLASLGALNAAFIEVAGSASGTFGSTGTSVTTSGASSITYFGSTFTGFLAPDLTTVDPNDYILGVGNVASPPANIDNFGSFTVTPNGLAGAPYTDTFSLVLTFALPAFASGTNPSTYTANVSGTVFTNGTGGVTFNFPSSVNLPNFQYAYSFVAPLCAVPVPGCVGPLTTGNLNVSVNDVTVISGATSAVTGTLGASTTVVPEPSTCIFVGAGLLLVARARRFKGASRIS